MCMRGVSPGGRHSAHLWGLHDGPGVVGSCQQAVGVYERGEPWGVVSRLTFGVSMMVLVWWVAASRLSVCMRGVSPGGRPSAHLWGLHDGPGVVGSCQQAVGAAVSIVRPQCLLVTGVALPRAKVPVVGRRRRRRRRQRRQPRR